MGWASERGFPNTVYSRRTKEELSASIAFAELIDFRFEYSQVLECLKLQDSQHSGLASLLLITGFSTVVSTWLPCVTSVAEIYPSHKDCVSQVKTQCPPMLRVQRRLEAENARGVHKREERERDSKRQAQLGPS